MPTGTSRSLALWLDTISNDKSFRNVPRDLKRNKVVILAAPKAGEHVFDHRPDGDDDGGGDDDDDTEDDDEDDDDDIDIGDDRFDFPKSPMRDKQFILDALAASSGTLQLFTFDYFSGAYSGG